MTDSLREKTCFVKKSLSDFGGGLRLCFGQSPSSCSSMLNEINLQVNIPVFGEESTSVYPLNGGRTNEYQGFHLLETDTQLFGALVKPITYPLENPAYDIYLHLLELSKDWNLCRIWNYVPYINDESRGLENYKSFCKGRSLAFEKFYGKDFQVKLPAATGVGIAENTYVLYFIAIKENILNVENPQQVPAFHYPRQYGPRSPSFARGTAIDYHGKHIGYLSGTASIKGHQSLGKGDIAKQFYVTLDNMRLVFEQMGFSSNFTDPELYERYFTIYFRHLSDLPLIEQMVTENFLPTDRLIYLHMDICRAELDIEIEATITQK